MTENPCRQSLRTSFVRRMEVFIFVSRLMNTLALSPFLSSARRLNRPELKRVPSMDSAGFRNPAPLTATCLWGRRRLRVLICVRREQCQRRRTQDPEHRTRWSGGGSWLRHPPARVRVSNTSVEITWGRAKAGELPGPPVARRPSVAVPPSGSERREQQPR